MYDTVCSFTFVLQLFSLADMLNATTVAAGSPAGRMSKTPQMPTTTTALIANAGAGGDMDDFGMPSLPNLDEEAAALLRDRETLSNSISTGFDAHMSRILNTEDKVRKNKSIRGLSRSLCSCCSPAHFGPLISGHLAVVACVTDVLGLRVAGSQH